MKCWSWWLEWNLIYEVQIEIWFLQEVKMSKNVKSLDENWEAKMPLRPSSSGHQMHETKNLSGNRDIWVVVGYSGQPQHQLALTSTYCSILSNGLADQIIDVFSLISILIIFCMSVTFRTVSRFHQNPGPDPWTKNREEQSLEQDQAPVVGPSCWWPVR